LSCDFGEAVGLAVTARQHATVAVARFTAAVEASVLHDTPGRNGGQAARDGPRPAGEAERRVPKKPVPVEAAPALPKKFWVQKISPALMP
jgi:hypothetical protein